MAKQVKLSARARAETGRSGARKLRREGLIPAVIYGRGATPENLQVSEREVRELLSHATSEHILVDLEVDSGGRKTSRSAIIQDVQHRTLDGGIAHVDFHAISMDERLESTVPVEPAGEAVGVKTGGGVLEQGLRDLDIECLPKDLPDVVRVDVSGLEIGGQITVGQIALPPGVVAKNDPDVVVFVVSAPTVRDEAAEAAEAAAAPAQPEVIREKKEEAAE